MPTHALAANELDDPSALSPSGRFRALKQFGLVVLCAAWSLLGTVGHDPWKTEDATAFGVAYEMLQRGDALVPYLAGEPFTDLPPLAYAMAAATGKVFSPPLPMHDAVRLAAGLMLGLTVLLLSATAIELHGQPFRWMAVLLLIGSVGLWDRAHQLSPELGLMLGIACALYGLALALRRPAAGGAILGVGVAIAFLSRGFLGPVWVGITAVALPALFATWRTRHYALTLAVALVLAIALGGAWPLALFFHAPEHLQAWWTSQSLGDQVSLLHPQKSGDASFLVKNLLWFAWPALPLVFWTVWTRGRGFNGGLSTPAVQIPGVLALVITGAMVAMAEPRAITLMPLLLPLSLLGALEIDTLKRGFSGALDWFGILTFGLLAGLVWWLWFDAYAHGMSPAVARLFRDTEVGYRPSFHWTAFGVSVLLSLLWLALVRPARRSNRRAVLNWAVGMTLLWGLYSTLWLPYLDSRRSYRTVAESVRAVLPPDGCTASRNLGEAQRALFHYFADLRTVREEVSPIDRCKALLVQYGRDYVDAGTPDGWQAVWNARRRGDDTERYVLYVRSAP